MKTNKAVEKWGGYVVTLKRADELEVGDEILEIYDDIHCTFPYEVKKKKVEKFPKWEVTILFHTKRGEGEPVNFEKIVPTNHLFPVIWRS
jgi:hypothetical protein